MSKKQVSFKIENKGGKAHLSITGYIGGWKTNAESFTRQVDDLLEAGVEDVEGYINSFGGSTFDGIEIGNQVKRFPGTKTVIVGSVAASMASALIPVFDKAKGYSNTQVMMHDPIMVPVIKSEADFESNKQLYVNTKNNLIDMYDSKMNLGKKKIAKMMNKTTWLNSTQCVENGLFNEIIDQKDSLPADAGKLTNLYNSELPTQLVAAIQSTNQSNNKNQNDMKEVLKALGLPENATEEQAVKAINTAKENGVNALTALGEAKGMKKEHITKLANADFGVAMEIIADTEAPKADGGKAVTFPEGKRGGEATPKAEGGEGKQANADTAQVNIVDAIANALKNGSPEAKKSVDDYSPAELEALFEKDPKAYGKLVGVN